MKVTKKKRQRIYSDADKAAFAAWVAKTRKPYVIEFPINMPKFMM